MRKFLQNKLWRDKLPEIIESAGAIVHIEELDDATFVEQLSLKLLEEAQEVQAAQTKEELVDELADLFEVVDTLCNVCAITSEEIKNVQEQKKKKRGGFEGRKFVTFAEFEYGSTGAQYCLDRPEKYPEIIE